MEEKNKRDHENDLKFFELESNLLSKKENENQRVNFEIN